MRSGFSTLTLAYWIDSLVRVSRRDGKSHFDKIARRPLKPKVGFTSKLTASYGHFTSIFPNLDFILSLAYENDSTTKCLICQAYEVQKHIKTREVKLASYTNDYSFTTFFSTISSLLTLFSKFFSPFLRSTCSLSVSHKYLALEEVYLPFRAAIPNNPTLRKNSLNLDKAKNGIITLYDALFQETYAKPGHLRIPL